MRNTPEPLGTTSWHYHREGRMTGPMLALPRTSRHRFHDDEQDPCAQDARHTTSDPDVEDES